MSATTSAGCSGGVPPTLDLPAWRPNMVEKDYNLHAADVRPGQLLGDRAPYPHAVYPDDDLNSMRISLREDEAWWRQALGDRYDQVLAYRMQLDLADGGASLPE